MTLQDILVTTSDYPETLLGTISVIQSSLPLPAAVPPMADIFASQEVAAADMANHLSSLTGHYEQMVHALHDSEAGETFAAEDLQGNPRTTSAVHVPNGR